MKKAVHQRQTAGLFVPFSCLSKEEWRWCAGKIWFRFRIHLFQVHLTAPERTGPDRQATSPVSEYERHEWTIWSHCVDFGTERTKVYVCHWKTWCWEVATTETSKGNAVSLHSGSYFCSLSGKMKVKLHLNYFTVQMNDYKTHNLHFHLYTSNLHNC